MVALYKTPHPPARKTFENTPSMSRWRIDGDRWRMFYFTSLKGAAPAEMKKDGID